MEPLTLVVAAGAYVAAEITKKSADEAITAAYQRIKDCLWKVFGAREGEGTADASKDPSLANDVQLNSFAKDVLDRSPALRRASKVASVLAGARILWVDDAPINNHYECRMLTALGARVRQVKSTEVVLAECGGSWDLILSDIARGGMADAGIQMLERLPGAPPVVFYVGRVDESKPVPRGAFGVADLSEPLLHLVLDVLERRRV